MNIEFIVNDYALVWALLFQKSISETIYELKQRVWFNYKEEYNNLYKDKEIFLKDSKNFIPNNDQIYNTIMESKEYEKIRKQTEKYRLEIMQIWDSKKKEIAEFTQKMFKQDLGTYKFLVVSSELNIIDTVKDANNYEKTFIIGVPIDKKEPTKIIQNILIAIFNKEIKNYSLTTEEFKKAIVELAIVNEFSTNMTGNSCYKMGDESLLPLKNYLYPYWLMFLGVPKEDFFKYMMRDNIPFDAEKYAYEKELKKMDIEDFIDFCIRNKRYIIRSTTTIKV